MKRRRVTAWWSISASIPSIHCVGFVGPSLAFDMPVFGPLLPQIATGSFRDFNIFCSTWSELPPWNVKHRKHAQSPGSAEKNLPNSVRATQQHWVCQKVTQTATKYCMWHANRTNQSTNKGTAQTNAPSKLTADRIQSRARPQPHTCYWSPYSHVFLKWVRNQIFSHVIKLNVTSSKETICGKWQKQHHLRLPAPHFLPLHSIQPAHPAHCPEASRSLSRDPKNCWAVTKAVTSPSTADRMVLFLREPKSGKDRSLLVWDITYLPEKQNCWQHGSKGKNEMRLNICTLRSSPFKDKAKQYIG